ncbi:putative ArsR family transcriptional regulator [Laceyella sediminis]|jgi:predicted ArsR family transcriptional regulator|uniref:ArsR family transcriptional regulator n=1 Tax=Laceyella sediminis TaxID=573074 RepID=A0ABX5EQ76_9BACL|nr:metalloregulator ArsR/SmtB family transcription factor [Laceyella sediminis]PRZ13932.1 putative ArsR family transcriptional regulator [Laceyella sediminis]
MQVSEAGSTRKQILLMLKMEGPLTVGEMAERLGVTEMAVRRHINTLERDGLIQARLLRQAMGRPTSQYFLTEKSDEHFPKSYSNFTIDLLHDLEKNFGSELVDQLFNNREERLAEAHQMDFAGKDFSERVRTLAEIQDQKGYMVKVEELPDGSYELIEYNCPIFQVANQYNHACQCELNWFERMLDARVERPECQAKGGQHCVFRIKQKERSENAPLS